MVKQPKYGFYISGGGVAAIECIGGMLEALRDIHSIVPTHIISCSGGGIPAGLFMRGVDLLKFYESIKINDYITLNSVFKILSGSSLFDTSKLKCILEDYVGLEFIDNFYCNVTNNVDQKTYYAKANSNSILASASIPEVFPPVKLSVDGYYYEEYKDNGFIKLKKKEITFESMEVVDGGIYDLIPTPTKDEWDQFDKIFILICNKSPDEDITQFSRIKRSITEFLNTMEREYHQVVKDLSGYKNVYILRPNDTESHLLSWSKDFICYKNAYNYIKNINFDI